MRCLRVLRHDHVRGQFTDRHRDVQIYFTISGPFHYSRFIVYLSVCFFNEQIYSQKNCMANRYMKLWNTVFIRISTAAQVTLESLSRRRF